MLDPVLICMYCGDLMDHPGERAIEVFGTPQCCEFDMLMVERDKLYRIHEGLDELKKKIEEEMIKGM